MIMMLMVMVAREGEAGAEKGGPERAPHLGSLGRPQKKYWDNVTGRPLEAWRVEEARMDEIKFFQKQGVYEKVLRTTCFARTGKSPIKVRWVDVNKGDEQNPDDRSRLVAMEFKTDSSADWFSGTPPLEALRFLCSDWATLDQGLGKERGQDRCMIIVDVKKAHLKAPATREVYVEIPKEDQAPGEEGLCGLLKYSMYGTRDAAKNWRMKVYPRSTW